MGIDLDSLNFVNEVYSVFGIKFINEDGCLIPTYNGEKLEKGKICTRQVMDRERKTVYELPKTPYTKALRVSTGRKEETLEICYPDPDYDADRWEIGLIYQPFYFDEKRCEHKVEGLLPRRYLRFETNMPLHFFEVRLADNYDNKIIETDPRHNSYIEADDDFLMSIIFATKKAIIVKKDKVLVGKEVDEFFGSSPSYTEEPYSSYEELEIILETAVEGLLNGSWMNPNHEDLNGNTAIAVMVRVIRTFLSLEIKRNVEYLKKISPIVEKPVQMIKSVD